MTATGIVRPFVPAAGHDRCLPFYDALTRLLGVDRAREPLVGMAGLRPGHRVLDVGCGTGTLPILIKERHPWVDVMAVDPDPKALAAARRKAARARVVLRFDEGYADALPYPDACFDRVFSSMMFHHLALAEKVRTLLEVRRVLRPGGRLQLLDFAGPEEASGLARWIHSRHRLRDNAADRVVGLMRDTGFVESAAVARRRGLFGTLVYYQAIRRP